MRILRFSLLIVAMIGLSGCIFATVVGGSTATSSAVHDKRSLGEQLDDIVLAGKIRGRMTVEKDLPSRWVSVEVVEGRVVLTGYLPKKNQIRRAIDDPVTSGFSIHVETVDGKVYLQGPVKSNIERHRARDVAFSIKGVVDVVDMMNIEKR